MLSIVKLVLSSNVLSSSRRQRAMSIARSVGIFKKSETTSNDSNTSPSFNSIEDMNWTKSPEFFTVDVE